MHHRELQSRAVQVPQHRFRTTLRSLRRVHYHIMTDLYPSHSYYYNNLIYNTPDTSRQLRITSRSPSSYNPYNHALFDTANSAHKSSTSSHSYYPHRQHKTSYKRFHQPIALPLLHSRKNITQPHRLTQLARTPTPLMQKVAHFLIYYKQPTNKVNQNINKKKEDRHFVTFIFAHTDS